MYIQNLLYSLCIIEIIVVDWIKVLQSNLNMDFKMVNKKGSPFLYFPDVDEPKRRAEKYSQQQSSDEDPKIHNSNPGDTQSSEKEGFWEPNTDLLTKTKSKILNSKTEVSEVSDTSSEKESSSETENNKIAKVENLRKHIPNVNEEEMNYLVSGRGRSYNNDQNGESTTTTKSEVSEVNDTSSEKESSSETENNKIAKVENLRKHIPNANEEEMNYLVSSRGRSYNNDKNGESTTTTTKSEVSEVNDTSSEKDSSSETEKNKIAKAENLRKHIPKVNEEEMNDLVSSRGSSYKNDKNGKSTTYSLSKIIQMIKLRKLNSELLKSMKQPRPSRKEDVITSNRDPKSKKVDVKVVESSTDTKESSSVESEESTSGSTINVLSSKSYLRKHLNNNKRENTTDNYAKDSSINLRYNNTQLSEELSSETEESLSRSKQSQEDKSKIIINLSSSNIALRKHLNEDASYKTLDESSENLRQDNEQTSIESSTENDDSVYDSIKSTENISDKSKIIVSPSKSEKRNRDLLPDAIRIHLIENKSKNKENMVNFRKKSGTSENVPHFQNARNKHSNTKQSGKLEYDVSYIEL